MIRNEYSYQEKITILQEREKELKCLYRVEEIINENLPIEGFFMSIIKHIWGGWQYPVITRVKIIFEGTIYKEPGWEETEWSQHSDIIIDDNVLGRIEVYYISFKRMIVDSQFLPEEQKLLNTIAARISTFIFNKRLTKTVEVLEKTNNTEEEISRADTLLPISQSDSHWIWRNEMALKIASKLDFDRFGIKAMYLIGSTKNGTAGPASDIDLLIHFNVEANCEKELKLWFEGWSLCLSEINYSKTGFKTDGLIDLHLITDKDIKDKTSFATMIGDVTNGAKLLKLKEN